jgi:hypothetical protein
MSPRKGYGSSALRIDYDTSAIDLSTFVKNLKTTYVELTEKIYVDKPLKK